MPFIRDWQFNFNAVTATSLAVKCPLYEQNDLLLAICSADTGTTQAWSLAGWTQLFSTTNTANLGILYKIAGASEADPTFVYSISETANIHLLSIGDVNTSTPFNGTGGAGAGYRTAANSAARAALPVLTTTVNNSLILYINVDSGVVIPGVWIGACIMEDAMDGNAHSHGWSWGFKATAGATPSDVYGSKLGTAAGILATIGISPPSGGATVIPTYPSADGSVYINPISGTTGYNSDTAFGATITTNFGTLVGARTLANGTVAASADVGLLPYHSMAQITGVSTDGTYAGGNLLLATANKPNVAGKNVITHIRPSTPKIYQNLDGIAKATSKGVVFGMASSAGNYKFWHVHGRGTGWNVSQHIPIVINSSATALASTGSLVDTSISAFGFAVSGTLAAPVIQVGSLWVLDTTTIAGGNAANPVGVPGIVKACATGKERMSALIQGGTQMLLLQPVQFGDGGTNPIYLNLDSTAIEFPRQYSVTNDQVFYNSVDNVAGLTYYAGASDTIKHTNAVVSSPSKYHWRVHASSSGSASYDFSGLSIIGAGDVQLRAVTNFSGMSFTNCPTVNQNSATMTGAVLYNSKIISAALGDMDNITSSSFTSSGTGHAIEVTGTAATITFTGNTFSGYTAYTAGGTSTGNEALFINIASGNVVINVSSGSTPSYKSAGATVTVNNSISLTVTGLVTNSDIVILDAGTSTERVNVDSNAGTSYVYSFTTGGSVDICVYKAGYRPYIVRGYTLPASNSSLPVSQVVDLNYLP